MDELNLGSSCEALRFPPYHAGFACRDIDAAIAAIGYAANGWSSIESQSDHRLCNCNGPTGWKSRTVFTRSGPVHMELIEGDPESVWGTDQLVVPHHVAYWTEHFARDSDVLISEGWELELTLREEDGVPFEFGYYRKAGLSRVELVDIRRREGFLKRVGQS